MAYKKQNFVDNETVLDAEHLEHIEDGIVENAEAIEQLNQNLPNKAPKTHTHNKSEITDFPTKMDPTAHNQSADTITAGTFGGQVVANANGQPAGVSCLRNSWFSFDESVVPTVEGETVWFPK